MRPGRLKLPCLYLVVDTTIPEEKLLWIVRQCLEGGVDILQLWSGKKDPSDLLRIGQKVLTLARKHDVPCLVGDDIELCRQLGADGVHFDGYVNPPVTPREVKQRLGSEMIVGLTCGNSTERLRWAETHGADYVSFCAVFPTSSVDSCEIVPLNMIGTAKKILTIPVFASGGITVENVEDVLAAGADGVAVVSALLSADNPKKAAMSFKRRIQRFVSS